MGALVLGQAAVAAGIVSPFIVIIVAGTAIASFLIPNYSSSLAIRLLRYPMLFLAGAFGLIGIFLGYMFLLLHLASLRSFGVPYLYPSPRRCPVSGRMCSCGFPGGRWCSARACSAHRTRRRTAAGSVPGASTGWG